MIIVMVTVMNVTTTPVNIGSSIVMMIVIIIVTSQPCSCGPDVFEAYQQPGELLFTPSGVIHGIRNSAREGLTCGLTANYTVGQESRCDPPSPQDR
jgi:hypothetical protein